MPGSLTILCKCFNKWLSRCEKHSQLLPFTILTFPTNTTGRSTSSISKINITREKHDFPKDLYFTFSKGLCYLNNYVLIRQLKQHLNSKSTKLLNLTSFINRINFITCETSYDSSIKATSGSLYALEWNQKNVLNYCLH